MDFAAEKTKYENDKFLAVNIVDSFVTSENYTQKTRIRVGRIFSPRISLTRGFRQLCYYKVTH